MDAHDARMTRTEPLQFKSAGTATYQYEARDATWVYAIERGDRNWFLTNLCGFESRLRGRRAGAVAGTKGPELCHYLLSGPLRIHHAGRSCSWCVLVADSDIGKRWTVHPMPDMEITQEQSR